MSTPCPTLAEIQTAFSAELQAALASLVAAGTVSVVPPAQDFDADAKRIMAISSLNTDRVQRAELGGRGALGIRSGVFQVNLSALKGTSQKTHWDTAQTVENHFAQYSAAPLTLASGGGIYCDFPYTMNAGTTPDKRIALLVTIPWQTWASN